MSHGRITKRFLWWYMGAVRCYGFCLYWNTDRNPIVAYSRSGKAWVFQAWTREWQHTNGRTHYAKRLSRAALLRQSNTKQSDH